MLQNAKGLFDLLHHITSWKLSLPSQQQINQLCEVFQVRYELQTTNSIVHAYLGPLAKANTVFEMVLRQFLLVVCMVGLALSSWAQSNYKKESSLGFFIGANAAGFRANLNENADVSAIQYQRDRSGIQFGSFLMHDAMKNVKWQYGLGMVMQYHLISYTPVPVVPVGNVEHWSANLFAEVAPLVFIGSEEKPGARPYVSPAVRGRYDINYEEGFFRPVSLAASFAVGLQSSTNVSDDKNFHLAPELKIERDLSNRYKNEGVSLFATTVFVSIKFY